LIVTQAFRHLRQWSLAGRFLARAIPILVVGVAVAARHA
jgi:hypothetical protein